LVAVGLADAREEEAEIVVNLGYGPDRGAGIATCRLLLDRDGGGESLDGVHIGFLHLFEKLPRIRGEGLHIAALALRVDGVECQGRLSGTGQSRDHNQLAAWDGDRDVLEIVLACPVDDQTIDHSNRLWEPDRGMSRPHSHNQGPGKVIVRLRDGASRLLRLSGNAPE